MVKRFFALCFLMLSALAAVSAESAGPGSIQLYAAAEASQGQALFALLALPEGHDGGYVGALRARLEYSDGSKSPSFPAYMPPLRVLSRPERLMLAAERADHGYARPPALALATLGISTEAPVGQAWLVVERDGLEMARKALAVRKRDFPPETLYLSPALTGIRVDPDPRKDEQAKRYQEVLAGADPEATFLSQGFARPVSGQRRTSYFGERRIYRYSTGGSARSVHAGVDYGYPTGTPIYAAGAGRVVMAEDRIATGLTVVIEHLPGVFTIYMHMDALGVSRGQLVERGQGLGTVGATGLATGPHLHWELRVGGVACDPEALIGLDKVPDIRTMFRAPEGG